MSDPPRRFTLVLEAMKDGDAVPVEVRLRLLLKRALRSYLFRCVEAREITPPMPPDQPDTQEKPL